MEVPSDAWASNNYVCKSYLYSYGWLVQYRLAHMVFSPPFPPQNDRHFFIFLVIAFVRRVAYIPRAVDSHASFVIGTITHYPYITYQTMHEDTRMHTQCMRV